MELKTQNDVMKKNVFHKIYEYYTGTHYVGMKVNPIISSSQYSCFLIGVKHPMFPYLLDKTDDEKKENFLLLLNSIKSRNYYLVCGVFIFYNVIKYILWNRGYFATFFFHTRFYVFGLFFTSLYLINKNYEANLIRSGLIRYKEKRMAYLKLKRFILMEDKKREVLEMKKL